MLQLPAHRRVNEARSFLSLRRRDLRHLLATGLLRPRRCRLSAVVDTPVVQLDILVEDAEPLVDHERRQGASQFRENAAQLGDDGRM